MAVEEWIRIGKAERAQAREANELRLLLFLSERVPSSSFLPPLFPSAIPGLLYLDRAWKTLVSKRTTFVLI